MSRLTPAETAYRDSIAKAKSLPDIMAVINEAAAARRPVPPASAATASAQPITRRAPAAPVTVSVPAAATVEQDGSDIVALVRSAGLVGMSPPPAAAKPSHHADATSGASDIVALVRAARLAGFNHQNKEQSK